MAYAMPCLWQWPEWEWLATRRTLSRSRAQGCALGLGVKSYVRLFRLFRGRVTCTCRSAVTRVRRFHFFRYLNTLLAFAHLRRLRTHGVREKRDPTWLQGAGICRGAAELAEALSARRQHCI
jgi:hypothetical protein